VGLSSHIRSDGLSEVLTGKTSNTVGRPLDDDRLNPAALERALQLARKAVELDPLLPEGHAALEAVLPAARLNAVVENLT